MTFNTLLANNKDRHVCEKYNLSFVPQASIFRYVITIGRDKNNMKISMSSNQLLEVIMQCLTEVESFILTSVILR